MCMMSYDEFEFNQTPEEPEPVMCADCETLLGTIPDKKLVFRCHACHHTCLDCESKENVDGKTRVCADCHEQGLRDDAADNAYDCAVEMEVA